MTDFLILIFECVFTMYFTLPGKRLEITSLRHNPHAPFPLFVLPTVPILQ
jgi:hypothetical protein